MSRLRLVFLILLTILAVAPARAANGANTLDTLVVPAEASAHELLALVRPRIASSNPGIAEADLRLEHQRQGLVATHYRFGQWIDQQRVHGAELVFSVGPDGTVLGHHVSLVSSRQLTAASRVDLLEELSRRHPELEDARVTERARSFRNIGGVARAVERLTVEDAPLRFTIWEVNPVTGEVLSKTPLYASVAGRVFPANPVTTLNDPTLRDEGDSASAVPPAAYLDVDMSGLAAQGPLEGPRVRIVDIDPPFTTRATIESGLIFTRDRDEFEEVNAYHHLDQSQLYLQSLGYTGSLMIVPGGVRVDVHANRGADNSFFTTGAAGPTLLFGDGGVDDAEDPDIILHEYAHAIHDSLAPGLLFGTSDSEGRAVSEGFGDYWAFSAGFAASAESGRDSYCIGDWDARCDGPDCAYPPGADCLRRVDGDLTIDDFMRSASTGTEHRNGRIWSTFLRDVFEALVARRGFEQGRRIADTLALEGLQGLPSQPRFAHLVANMIQADAILFGSEHGRTICSAARTRKFEVPSSCTDPMRGETIVLPGTDSISIPAGGGSVERSVMMSSDATIERVMIALALVGDVPADLEISLAAPDGTHVVLKKPGSTLPRSVTFGRDYPPAEPLEELEGRPNPGIWVLRASSDSPVVIAEWAILFELGGAAKFERREYVSGSRTVAAVANTPGAGGTFFISDLAIANPGSAGELLLIYTPSGEDGTESYSAIRVGMPSGASFVLGDVVGSLFDTEGTGSLEIRGAGPAVRVSSRTYNRAEAGSFGQTIPEVGTVAESGERLVLSQIRRNLEFRTNIGLVETGGSRVEASITLRDQDGTPAGSTTVILEPFTHGQIPIGEFASVIEIASGWAEIMVTGEGRVGAYSSVVDNRTGDSVFVPGEPVPTDRRGLIIPAAAHAPGARGTVWRTDLWLVNDGDGEENVEMRFHRSDGGVISANVVIPASASKLFEDVVAELFETEGTGWILVQSSLLTVSSRTWNDDPAGSFGQFVGALTFDQAATKGDTIVVPNVGMNPSFRTNVGVTAVSGDGAAIRIDVMNRSGSLECSVPLFVAPGQHWQASVAQLGCAALDGGRIELIHLDGEGRIVGYASIVDQRTGDPSYIRAE